MNNEMYGVICESDRGIDAFDNPKGEIMLFEGIGEGLSKGGAIDRASQLQASGNYGKVKIVRLEVMDYIIT